ncbi:uncharacterized protein ARMOST_19790 [Armillaria ostoyae]|uniref:Uncharacterized protein n=1 Tax=Armillaria ostoyae TaxID=47428 RepID=A0A284S5K2_ARMOS|nr:uncharacterized protein ARMOST_19790 [Armillaria ostoyae]
MTLVDSYLLSHLSTYSSLTGFKPYMKIIPDVLLDLFEARTTRSKHVFSPWDMGSIDVPDPEFDFERLVKSRMADEDELAALDAFDPMDTRSPLSSVPPSPSLSTSSPSHTMSNPTEISLSTYHTPGSSELQDSATRLSHSKKQSKASRKRKHAEQKAHARITEYKAPPRLHAKHVQGAEPLMTAYATEEALHASTGYVGLVEDSWKRVHTLEELTGPKFGFSHKKWNGSVPNPVIDRDRRVIAVMAGQPDDPNWPQLADEAAETLERL